MIPLHYRVHTVRDRKDMQIYTHGKLTNALEWVLGQRREKQGKAEDSR